EVAARSRRDAAVGVGDRALGEAGRPRVRHGRVLGVGRAAVVYRDGVGVGDAVAGRHGRDAVRLGDGQVGAGVHRVGIAGGVVGRVRVAGGARDRGSVGLAGGGRGRHGEVDG